MSSSASKILRASAALPFIGLSLLCLREMDIESMVAHQQPFLETRKIEWDNGSIPILSRFHYWDFLDEIWRGTTASFSPSTLGYDAVSSWQLFSFLNDLGPLYAVWLLESTRRGNKWSPAFVPTIFAFLGQLLGLGSVAPLFYFLCFTFGPSATELVQSPKKKLAVENVCALLPLTLLLHTSEVFAAFLAPSPLTRHYWTWAWQMTPLWLGIANFAISRVIRIRAFKSTEALLGVLSAISAGVWLFTVMRCDYSLSTVFLPDASAQSEFVPHMRRALQFDEICTFASSFLWLAYSFADMHRAGLTDKWLVPAAVLPIAFFSIGPGATFAAFWYWRELKLQSKQSRE